MVVKVTAKEVAERYFNCNSCGARGEVSFDAIGVGWQRRNMWQMLIMPLWWWRRAGNGPRADEQAAEDLMADAERTLALVKCPTCGKRSSGSVLWATSRVVAWVGFGYVLTLLGSPHGLTRFAAYGYALYGVAAYQLYRELGRFKRARDVEILKLKPGTLSLAELAPEPKQTLVPELPVARALAAPPVARVSTRPSSRPSPPIAVAPPPSPPQRAAADEPAFLRDKD